MTTPAPLEEPQAAVGSGDGLCGGVESEECHYCGGVASRLGYDLHRGIVYEDCPRCDGTGRVPKNGTRSHSTEASDRL